MKESGETLIDCDYDYDCGLRFAINLAPSSRALQLRVVVVVVVLSSVRVVVAAICCT